MRRAFDALSVDLHHHVVFLEVGLCRRTVRNNLSQHHAALGGELQFLGLVRRDFVRFDAQPARIIVADDDIHVIHFDVRQNLDPRRRLVLYNDSLPRLFGRVRVGKHRLLILLPLDLGL